jgi:hypothetical protein
MVQAKIYRPAKSAMQSGKARSRQWVLEFSSTVSIFIDPVMGWNGSNDTLHQLKLTFRSLESALAYAKAKNLEVEIETAHNPAFMPKSYADNFRYDRAL